ncbi:hypothetical protein SHIRM173S_01899 [Streptomyces hirsutus]
MDEYTVTTACGRSGTAVVRGAELDRLVAAVTAPRAAEPVTRPVHALLTVVGGFGAGKTTLVEAVVARFAADGGRVLKADSSQSETHLAFSGLRQLLRPVRGRIDALPLRQRGALHVAFGVAERSEAPDPMLIGTAVLTMLSDLAAERPLLVVVDDARGRPRLAGRLSFVARRLAGEPVTLLVATRDPTLRGLAVQEPTLTLEPLDRGAAERLLDLQPRVPAGLTRASILDQAEGNPLALLDRGPGRRRPRQHVPHDLTARVPVTERLGRVYADRLAALRAETRRAVARLAGVDNEERRAHDLLSVPGRRSGGLGTPACGPDSSGEAGDDARDAPRLASRGSEERRRPHLGRLAPSAWRLSLPQRAYDLLFLLFLLASGGGPDLFPRARDVDCVEVSDSAADLLFPRLVCGITDARPRFRMDGSTSPRRSCDARPDRASGGWVLLVCRMPVPRFSPRSARGTAPRHGRRSRVSPRRTWWPRPGRSRVVVPSGAAAVASTLVRKFRRSRTCLRYVSSLSHSIPHSSSRES